VEKLPEIPEITYSLRDRKRKHTGVDRNFNLKALVSHINSQEVQERVRNRELLGYYGHGVRILSGSMNPTESFMAKGKYIEVEPAIVTTKVMADENGIVTHKSEFLPTESGIRAAKAWSAKVGGFSSAIDGANWKFHGFDYVFDPNFSENRGYLFDSASCADVDYVDVIEQIAAEDRMITMAMYDKVMAENAHLHACLDSSNEEIEYLISRIISLEKNGSSTGDSLPSHGFVKPMILDSGQAASVERLANKFLSADLVPNRTLPKENKAANPVMDTLDQLWGAR